MTDPDKSRKDFICKHMNADHQKSLSLYLRVYCGISSRAAQSPILEDIRLTDLLISAKGTRYTIPFDPPLQNLSETRSRVVAMHNDCLRQLGLSSITVTEYRAPRGFHAFMFAACLATYVGYSQRGNFVPGSLVYETLGLAQYPGFTEFSYKYQPFILGFLGLSHLFEATVLMAGKRLRKHGVPFLSGVWVSWVLSNLVEGFGALQRFDQVVKEKRIEQEGHEKAN